MKTLALLFAITLSALGASGQTNTNSAANFPSSLQEAFAILGSNIPTGTNFATATFGVGTGITLRNGVVQNYIDADWYIKTNFFITFGIENAPSASTVNRGKIALGYRKAGSNYEYGVSLGAIRNWTPDGLVNKPSTQAVLEFRGDCNVVGSTVKSGIKLDFLTDSSQPLKRPLAFQIKLEAFKLLF